VINNGMLPLVGALSLLGQVAKVDIRATGTPDAMQQSALKAVLAAPPPRPPIGAEEAVVEVLQLPVVVERPPAPPPPPPPSPTPPDYTPFWPPILLMGENATNHTPRTVVANVSAVSP
jgi:hypothetical protein